MNAVNQIFSERTLNFAHRGFTIEAPENSLAAFRAAIDLGVDGIELDVRTCKTGELIVFHDPTLKRLTNGRGFVKSRTLNELKSLRLMSEQSSLNERIPTLEEALETVNGRVILNVEIKTKGRSKDRVEAEILRILKQYGVERRTIISSFNPVVIRRITRMDNQILTGLLIDKNFTLRNSEIPMTRFSHAKAVHLDKSLAKEKLIRKLQTQGYRSIVWSVNEPKVMQRLLDVGVDGIITDRPDLLKELMTFREGDG